MGSPLGAYFVIRVGLWEEIDFFEELGLLGEFGVFVVIIVCVARGVVVIAIGSGGSGGGIVAAVE